MKKILVISYLFAPENAIGAIRPTKLSKYLTQKNYSVDVLTTAYKNKNDNKLIIDIEKINGLTELNHSHFFERFYKRILSRGKKPSTLDKVTDAKKVERKTEQKKSYIKKISSFYFRQLVSLYRSFDFFIIFKKHVKKDLNLFKNYDVCISTFGPTASVLCGIWLKRKFPNMVWICDFRDPMVVEDTPLLFKIYNNYIQKKACKNADSIIAVSKGYLKRICNGKFEDKSYVIPNGYDLDDLPKVSYLNDSKKFSFVYPGSLYEGKRKFTLLFKVLRELYQESKIALDDIEFWYAGSDFSTLFNQAKQFNVENLLVNFGSLSRKECLELQFKSRFLVLTTWNNNGEEGVFPGKVLEYMLFNKPIIGLVSGNKKHSEIYETITSGRLGIVVEEMQEEHYLKFKQYILNEYKRFKNGENATNCPDKHIINQYNYKNITEKLISIIENKNS